MKKVFSIFLRIGLFSKNFSQGETVTECRDDLPSEQCFNLISDDGCNKLSSVDRDACTYSCKLCQYADCSDTLPEDQCRKLILSHSSEKCDKLEFRMRFKCRATCGICTADAQLLGPNVQLKGIKDMEILQTTGLDSPFAKPTREPNLENPGSDDFQFVNPVIDTDAFGSIDELKDMWENGVEVPVYALVAAGVGVGLLLWICAWTGWRCRKCAEIREHRDQAKFEKHFSNTILSQQNNQKRTTQQRHRNDPLPTPGDTTRDLSRFTSMATSDSYVIGPGNRTQSQNTRTSGNERSNATGVTESQSRFTEYRNETENISSRPSQKPKRVKRFQSTTDTTGTAFDNGDVSQRTFGEFDSERIPADRKFRDVAHKRKATFSTEPSNRMILDQHKNGHVLEEPSSESGIDISDSERKLLRQMQNDRRSHRGNEKFLANAQFFLAKDSKRELQEAAKANLPKVPIKLSPEEIQEKELQRMINQANNTINKQTDNDEDSDIEDVVLMPLGKKVSLGEPTDHQTRVVADHNEPKLNRRKSGPLSKWADEENVPVKMDRKVHSHDTRYLKAPKTKKEQIKNSSKKIKDIKKRIAHIEKETKLSDSNFTLSDLSDDGLMESVNGECKI